MTLLQLSDRCVAEYIDIFKKILGEGTAAYWCIFSVDFACNGKCSAQILCGPLYCPATGPMYCLATINPYTLRPLTGVHGDQMDEVLLYMAREDAKIARLHAKARL